ncbi:MAG: hypothetical protein JWP63_1552 [Candidatus Solibacter sp.]|nr:hypothetical protein [Candidatus Solibacter sp.]
MRILLIAGLAAGACFAQDIAVKVDGKPFTIFNYGKDANKPFLAPIRSASGKIVTRRFPMEKVEGESKDHLHHRGLWFSYDDVNGTKLWENDPSYTKPHMGPEVVRSAELKEGGKAIAAVIEWRDEKGKVLLVENRDMAFAGDANVRTIDFHITLTAAQDVTLGDTKEGAFAIRLDDAFTERRGMKMVDADGREKMANIWGKRSNWVDYSATLDGEKLGVAMFDHPSNPRHPTYWHARDYGLFALNPFGRQAFDPKQEESNWKIPTGQKIEFRWRVLIHPGDAQTGKVADLYKEYSAK